MKAVRTIVLSAFVAVVLVACSKPSAPAAPTGPAAVVITIGPPVMTVNTTGSTVCTTSAGPVHARCVPQPVTDTIVCSPLTPNPASATVGQTVKWFNNSGADLTLFQRFAINSGIPDSPIVTIPAGQTSGGVYWSEVGTITYVINTCTITGHVFDNYLTGQFIPPGGIYITAG